MRNKSKALPDKIKVLSANCQGLRIYEKRVDVLSYLKDTNASIVCLQDTHLLEKDRSSIRQIWPECYINGSKSNSRGVMILFNNNFEHDILDSFQDDEGNILQLLINLGTFKLNLINIYAPNRDSPNFFTKISELAQNEIADHVMMCGDFNLVLDPLLDCHNYTNINNPQARQKVLQMINNLDLTDSFRHLNNNVKRFSWRKKIPLKQGRLDYFLTSHTMIDMIDSCDIKPSYRSDHSIIEINLAISNFVIGRGTWKINNSLLKNKEYLALINRVIDDEKERYCLPVYNIHYIKENFADLTFSIDDDLFLEVLFMKIRGETIKFATSLKKRQTSQEKQLLQDITNLEATSLGQSNSTLLEDKKVELENLRKEKVRGHMIRTRLQWLNEGEKPTSFFCKLESKHCTEKTMKKIQTNSGTVVMDQKLILKEIENFYCNLFKSKDHNIENYNYKEEIKRANLKCVEKVQLGQEVSVTELGRALKK